VTSELILSPELVTAFDEFARRFVDRTNDPRGCWTYRFGDTRPVFSWASVQYQATHVAWLVKHGTPIPPGLYALHSCDNQMCFNADHLRPGTHAENMRDMVQRQRHHPEARAIGRHAVRALAKIGYVSIANATKAAGVTSGHLQSAIITGLVPAAMVLGRRFVRSADVARWLASPLGAAAHTEAAEAERIRQNRCAECGAQRGTFAESCTSCRAWIALKQLEVL